MLQKPIYSFNGTTSIGIDKVPLNGNICIEDVSGYPKYIVLVDKTGIDSQTTVATLLSSTSLWKSHNHIIEDISDISSIAGSGLTWTGINLDVEAVSIKRVILKTTINQNAQSTHELQWDSQDYIDSDTYTHSSSINNHQITIISGGIYNIVAQATYDNTGVDRTNTFSRIKINGIVLDDSYHKAYSRGLAYGRYITHMANKTISLSASDIVTFEVGPQEMDQTTAVNKIVNDASLTILKVSTEAIGNTWRDIHDTPTNAAINTSISSNWAYDYINRTSDTLTNLTLTSTEATSPTSGALMLTGITNSIVFDNDGGRATKRITSNDGGGNFNIRASNYYSSSEKYTTTDDGASKITLNSESSNGTIDFKVASIGSGDSTITWATNMSLRTTGLVIDKGIEVTGNILVSGNVDGVDIASEESRLSATSGTNTGDETQASVNALNIDADTLDGEQGSFYQNASNINAGSIGTSFLPAYVDDVLEFTNLAAFPATGETGKIYVDIDTNKTYRWSGTVYIYITSGAVDKVNNQTGVVVLDTDDINDTVSNRYISDAEQANYESSYSHSTSSHAPTDADNTATNETSHTDVLVDGDFGTAGIMVTDGAGIYSIDSNTYLTSETSYPADVLIAQDITDIGNLSGLNSGDQSAGDFNHDDLANITANEHIDWTVDDALVIHSANYTNTTYLNTDFSLDGLSDTTFTSISNDEIIKWNGTAWINNTLLEAGITSSNYFKLVDSSIAISSDNSALSQDDGTDNNNISIGNNSGTFITSGYKNIFIGKYAGTGDDINKVTGTYNIALGSSSGTSITSGSNNVVIGSSSGADITEGDTNILIGDSSGSSISTGNNNIFIGYASGHSISTSSNLLKIGNIDVGLSNKGLIEGDFFTEDITINADLGVYGDSRIFGESRSTTLIYSEGSILAEDTDLDTIDISGFYNISITTLTGTNSPITGNLYLDNKISSLTNNTLYQTIRLEDSDSSIWHRSSLSGVWGNWIQMVDTNNIPTLNRVTLKTSTTVDAGSSTHIVDWNLQDYIDAGTFVHSTTVSNSDLKILEDGVYEIVVNSGYINEGIGRVTIFSQLKINGTAIPETYDSNYSRGSNYGTNLNTSGNVILSLSINDIITFEVGVEDMDDIYVVNRVPSKCSISVQKIGYELQSNTWRAITSTPSSGDTTTSISSDWASGVASKITSYDFDATTSQTVFICNYNIDDIEVFVSGIKLRGTEFTATNGTSVTLNQAQDLDTWVQVSTR